MIRVTLRPAGQAARRLPDHAVVTLRRGAPCITRDEAPRWAPCRTVEPLRSCRAPTYTPPLEAP